MHRSTLLALSLFSASLSAAAVPTVYFGEDLGAASASALPNSYAARAQFLSQLVETGTQNFDGLTGGTDFFVTPTQLQFGGTGITGAVGGGLVRSEPFNARFPISGTNYWDSAFNQRITFSAPVQAFGLFVIDANESDNDPALVRINGLPLSQAQILARPFGSVDGVFRIVTERSPGNFEVLFTGGSFPAPDSSGMFVGLIDAAQPYTNIILINGTSGLDVQFQDGFGYDDLTIGQVTPIPEPSIWALMALGLLTLGRAVRRSVA